MSLMRDICLKLVCKANGVGHTNINSRYYGNHEKMAPYPLWSSVTKIHIDIITTEKTILKNILNF